MKRKFKHW